MAGQERTTAEQLARLRVAIDTGRLPRDLGRWCLAWIAESAPDDERRAARDDLLRRAAAQCPGSTWARAGYLAAELDAMSRRRSGGAAARALLAQAIELDPACPRTQRHLFRILNE